MCNVCSGLNLFRTVGNVATDATQAYLKAYYNNFTCNILFLHLVLFPGPEEVDGAILSPLDNGPSPLSSALVTPGLQEFVSIVWSQQVDAAGLLS